MSGDECDACEARRERIRALESDLRDAEITALKERGIAEQATRRARTLEARAERAEASEAKAHGDANEMSRKLEQANARLMEWKATAERREDGLTATRARLAAYARAHPCPECSTVHPSRSPPEPEADKEPTVPHSPPSADDKTQIARRALAEKARNVRMWKCEYGWWHKRTIPDYDEQAVAAANPGGVDSRDVVRAYILRRTENQECGT